MAAQKTYPSRLTAIVVVLALVSSNAQADVVNWRTTLDAAKIEAAQSGRLVLLHFWTPSCGPCRKLDKEVFSQPQVSASLEQQYVPVKVNAELSSALARAFNVTKVPTDIVLTSQGNVVSPLRCPLKAEDYTKQLMELAQHYHQTVSPNTAATQGPVNSAYSGLQVGQYRKTAASAVPGANFATAPVQQNQPYAQAAVSSPQVTNNRYATAPPAVTASPANPGVYANRYATTQPMAPKVESQQDATPAVPQTIQTPAAVASGYPATNTTPVSPAAVKAESSAPVQLAAGSLPLAFEGYCPVTLKQMRKWVAGDSQFGATHRGRTYLFTSEQQRQQFLANPDAFSPVFSGLDAVKLLEESKTVEGSRKFGFEYRGAFYLFGSKETMERFASRPDHYAAGVRQAMNRMDAATGGTIRR